MTRLMLPIAASLLLAACGGAPAAPAGDQALDGAGEASALTPVAARPVWVGRNADPRAPACNRRVQLRGEAVAVRWAPGGAGPAKATIGGEVLACDVEGEWTGIVFPGAGETVDYCNLNRRIRGATEYQGPCRSGWVRTADLAG